MELLVVGLGSMGKRRARLIRGVEPSAALAGVDFAPARREEARALGIEPYESIAAAVAARHFDAAFVCTAPLTHAGIIGELLDAGLPVFTELNLVDDGYDALIAKAAQKGLPLFLSSTMLYRAETQYIKRRVAAFAKPVNYIYHIGQYLPDWHHGKIIKTFLWATGARGACGRSSASICPGCWTLSVR
ncbi:MAG: Gfo/Idh/MocA family oxidoreductase [Ruthenibacterium lactatiformans]